MRVAVDVRGGCEGESIVATLVVRGLVDGWLPDSTVISCPSSRNHRALEERSLALGGVSGPARRARPLTVANQVKPPPKASRCG